ncbi:MAG: tRNA 2-selenouridine(34) synthase MnmH [Gammaproteobacteria bacterium]|nr:tRNA 2-selenouridine(34) synthase MnmH [Gammaproteobacteria bacterium]
MTSQDTNDYQSIFLEDRPLMDVRAPVEFEKGAFPKSQNIPILDDLQREAIGTCYKKEGQDAAIALGLQLVGADIREQRLGQWTQFVKAYPEGYLYCFRGGLRSRTTQNWLQEQGVNYPLIKGGYKAMRTYLLQQLELSAEQIPMVILSGLTGSGKTHVLNKTRYQIDLEGLANHRGSAFGSDINDFQPTQINWENKLSIDCLKYRHHYPDAGLLLEDESKRIGRNILPDSFYLKMQQAPSIFLQRELEQRVAIIRDDYFTSSWPLYQQQYQQAGEEKFSTFLLGSLARIKKRLGGVLYEQINASFTLALEHLFATGESNLFDEGVRLLLLEYYDPMYQYQLKNKQRKLVFSGTEPEILAWVEEHLKTMT